MTVPQQVIDAVRAATTAHMGDVDRAIEAAVCAVRDLPDFDAVQAALVDLAVQSLVYRERGIINVAIANRAAYVGPPKVSVGASAAVNRIAASVYNHAIGGTRLGDLTGADLIPLAEKEQAAAAGHEFNAALLLWCHGQGVTGDKRVRDVISEQKLTAAYKRLLKPTAAAVQRVA